MIFSFIAFFIAQSADEVKRALWFCKLCHEDVRDEKLIRRCKCKNRECIFHSFSFVLFVRTLFRTLRSYTISYSSFVFFVRTLCFHSINFDMTHTDILKVQCFDTLVSSYVFLDTVLSVFFMQFCMFYLEFCIF